MNQTLLDDYTALNSSHWMYMRNRDRWEFLYNSYVGGEPYRQGGYLIKYSLETDGEYRARLDNTPLDNQCASVISTYVSFLFRQHPDRDFATWEGRSDLEDFLNDCDMEGRSFDNFIKQVSIWASVFGHSFIIMSKPNLGLVSAQQEQELGIRPYVNLLTPLVVSDWRWRRSLNGRYELEYFKYVEEVADKITVVKEWTLDTVKTWEMDDAKKEARMISEEPNQLGIIPVVIVYNQRSVVKDLGVSDITDIADLQRQIYCLLSEQEQSIRLDGHPTLVTPQNAQVGSGAGAVIQLEIGSDAGLNPYYLSPGGDTITSIHNSIDKLSEAIDRISFTGGVRATRTQTQSGVSLEVEFSLLNGKLAEKGDLLELSEEQLWRLFALYQGLTWEGEIKYPDSFNIRDEQREMQQLATAKSAATDARVLQVIDHEIIELLGEDADLIMPEYVALNAETFPPEPLFEAHTMYNPVTGQEVIARTEAEHIAYMEQGYIHEEG